MPHLQLPPDSLLATTLKQMKAQYEKLQSMLNADSERQTETIGKVDIALEEVDIAVKDSKEAESRLSRDLDAIKNDIIKIRSTIPEPGASKHDQAVQDAIHDLRQDIRSLQQLVSLRLGSRSKSPTNSDKVGSSTSGLSSTTRLKSGVPAWQLEEDGASE